jgi:hypothetical protein
MALRVSHRLSARLHPHPALRAALSRQGRGQEVEVAASLTLSPVVSLYGERQAFAFGRGLPPKAGG